MSLTIAIRKLSGIGTRASTALTSDMPLPEAAGAKYSTSQPATLRLNRIMAGQCRGETHGSDVVANLLTSRLLDLTIPPLIQRLNR